LWESLPVPKLATSYPGSRDCRFCGSERRIVADIGNGWRLHGATDALRRAAEQLVFLNAEYPAGVRILAGPPWPDNVDYKKRFSPASFRIEHGGVSKGLALRLIQPDRVQSDDVVYTKIFSRIVALRSR
jgi:hypothetical protein